MNFACESVLTTFVCKLPIVKKSLNVLWHVRLKMLAQRKNFDLFLLIIILPKLLGANAFL